MKKASVDQSYFSTVIIEITAEKCIFYLCLFGSWKSRCLLSTRVSFLVDNFILSKDFLNPGYFALEGEGEEEEG